MKSLNVPPASTHEPEPVTANDEALSHASESIDPPLESAAISHRSPAAGDYLLYAHFYGTALISAFPPGLVNGRFYDETAAAAAGKAALVVAAQTVGPTYYVTTTLLTRYTASGANTIRLEFSRNTATFSGSTVQAVEYGYVKVG